MRRPVLILLNGAPASGKSTLARAWVDRHGADLPLALDIDILRSMLGGWQQAPMDAGLAARVIAVAGIRAHLASGRDVVVPQYLYRTVFMDQLGELAEGVPADFLECAVLVDAETAADRFDRRLAGSSTSTGSYAPVIHGGLGEHSMTQHVAELERVLAGRPHVVRLSGTLEEMLDQLDAAVAASR
jgi:chloramphenicol 3-O-phosphotransferase